ncbi:MAG: hypothetical protein EA424_27390 [Planctomycetaceae bacterium]|nr:MAG: hypothetical protein EA424_27390 [Planctomycetaceae bacterium]
MAKKTAPHVPATKPAQATANAPEENAASAGEEVNKSRLIQDILAVSPDRGPKDIADELTSMGVPTTPKYVSTIKTNMKTKAGLPKRKIRSKKIGSRSPTAPKVVPRKTSQETAAPTAQAASPSTLAKTPHAVSQTALSFEHLKMAKELARQLGGVQEAKQVLNALTQLTEE